MMIKIGDYYINKRHVANIHIKQLRDSNDNPVDSYVIDIVYATKQSPQRIMLTGCTEMCIMTLKQEILK